MGNFVYFEWYVGIKNTVNSIEINYLNGGRPCGAAEVCDLPPLKATKAPTILIVSALLCCRPACTDFEPFLIGFKAVGKPGDLIWCKRDAIMVQFTKDHTTCFAVTKFALLLKGNPVAKNLEFPFLSFVKIGKMNDCGTLQIQCVRNY